MQTAALRACQLPFIIIGQIRDYTEIPFFKFQRSLKSKSEILHANYSQFINK